jgi:cellobiose phosphorylase
MKMNLSSITARSVSFSLFEKVTSLFGLTSFSDACLYSFKNETYLGFVGLTKKAPIIKALLAHEEVRSFLDEEGLNKESGYLDSSSLHFADREVSLPEAIKKIVNEEVDVIKDYGGYLDEDGNEHLNLFSPEVGPHYGVNLLLGWREEYKEPLLSTPKSVVDQYGRGSFRGAANFQVLATRWDIRPEENGNPFNRQFYILENNKQIFYSANVKENVLEAFCVHYPGKSVISYVLKDGLKIERTIFLLDQKEGLPEAVEAQIVKLVSSKKRHLRIVFTGMFGFSNPECQEVDVVYQTLIHQSEAIVDSDNNVVALSPSYYPSYFKYQMRFASIVSGGTYMDSFSNDVNSFLGNGDINHPDGLMRLDSSLLYKGASFFAMDKDIDVDESPKYVISYAGMVDAEKEKDPDALLRKKLGALLSLYPDERSLLSELERKEKAFHDYSSFYQARSGDEGYISMVNRNLVYQNMYQSFVSRSFAQTQKGYREIGFREIQDLYASFPYLINSGHKDLAKDLLAKWIVNVYKMGYANHNFFYVGKEPGLCSDDQIWLLKGVATYISLSEDIGILDESFEMADGSSRKLIDTIDAIITYSGMISIGEHDLPLLDSADWNDCLKIDDDHLLGPVKEKAYLRQLKRSGAPYGSRFISEQSESVMNAFLLIEGMDEIRPFITKGKSLLKKIDDIEKRMKASLHKNAFINGYYARVLINRKHPKNGITYVGAPGDGLSNNKELDNGSLYLNSLSWALLSGVSNEEETRSMLCLAKKYLKTSSGYKLCTDEDLTLTGAKQAATSHYYPGDRENGGVFKHADMMFVSALLKGSKSSFKDEIKGEMLDEAYFTMDIVYPYHVLRDPYIYKGNPRFCTQYNNPLNKENIGPMLSGTATWTLLSILSSSGVSFANGGLSFKPRLSLDKKERRFSLHLLDATYDVSVFKEQGRYAYEIASMNVDGMEIEPSSVVKITRDGASHKISIKMR